MTATRRVPLAALLAVVALALAACGDGPATADGVEPNRTGGDHAQPSDDPDGPTDVGPTNEDAVDDAPPDGVTLDIESVTRRGNGVLHRTVLINDSTQPVATVDVAAGWDVSRDSAGGVVLSHRRAVWDGSGDAEGDAPPGNQLIIVQPGETHEFDEVRLTIAERIPTLAACVELTVDVEGLDDQPSGTLVGFDGRHPDDPAVMVCSDPAEVP